MGFLNKDVLLYLNDKVSLETGILGEIQSFAIENMIPIVPKETANFLKVMLGIIKPENVLEIGTAIGFSSSLILQELGTSGKITTIELSPERIQMAKENFKKQNIEDRVTLLEGDANEILSNLKDITFDLIFMDASKGQYINILPDCLRLLKKDGVLIADDVLQNGKIAKDIEEIRKKHRTIYRRMREFIDVLTSSENLDTTILPIGDGVLVSRKKW